MKQLAVSQFPLPILTVVALMIFFVVFCMIAFWAYRILSKDKIDEFANIALAGETPAHPINNVNPNPASARKEGRT